MKKNLRKLIWLVAYMVFMCGCSEKKSADDEVFVKDLFEDIKEDDASMYHYDGEKVSVGVLKNNYKFEETLYDLLSTKIVKANDWSADKATYPLYSIDTKNDSITWTNGYLFTESGDVYKMSYNFEKLKLNFEWSEKMEYDAEDSYIIPCMWHIIRNDSGFCNAILKEGKEDILDELKLTVLKQTDTSVMVEIKNEMDETWKYGNIFILQANIDGKWYNIPPMDYEKWVFTLEGYELKTGEVATKDFNFEQYGELPNGKYRLIASNEAAVEFEIEK